VLWMEQAEDESVHVCGVCAVERAIRKSTTGLEQKEWTSPVLAISILSGVQPWELIAKVC
jgi:hypothetical protein